MGQGYGAIRLLSKLSNALSLNETAGGRQPLPATAHATDATVPVHYLPPYHDTTLGEPAAARSLALLGLVEAEATWGRTASRPERG
jgi:hypothetical protein